jgi:hypothetical protein
VGDAAITAGSQLPLVGSSSNATTPLASVLSSCTKLTTTRSWKRNARGVTGDSIPAGESHTSPVDTLLPLPSIQGSGLKKCMLEDGTNDMLAKAAAEDQPRLPQ